MKTMRELQKAVYDNNVVHGWHDGGPFAAAPENIITKLMLVVTELAEAVEEIRNGHPYDKVYFTDGGKKPEGFAVELADAMIRLLDIAELLKIDMQEAIVLKHNYNITRPHRHGGKVI